MSDSQSVLKDLFVAPDFDKAAVNVSFTVPEGLDKVVYEVTADGKAVAGRDLVPFGPAVSFQIPLPSFRPWTLDDPFLYELAMTLTVNGQEQRVTQAFGMRKFHADGRRLYIVS